MSSSKPHCPCWRDCILCHRNQLWVYGWPQDNSCDCGLFMLCFMQFFSAFLPERGINSDVVDTVDFSGAPGFSSKELRWCTVLCFALPETQSLECCGVLCSEAIAWLFSRKFQQKLAVTICQFQVER